MIYIYIYIYIIALKAGFAPELSNTDYGSQLLAAPKNKWIATSNARIQRQVAQEGGAHGASGPQRALPAFRANSLEDE